MTASHVPRHSPYGDTAQPGAAPQAPPRPPTGRRTSPASPSLIDISHRPRPRDLTIANLLDEHTTLTTQQITDILFTTSTTCRHRLHALREIGFVDRFFRSRKGASPTCWVPGLLSARYASLARGDAAPSPRALRERQDRICTSPRLEHTRGDPPQ